MRDPTNACRSDFENHAEALHWTGIPLRSIPASELGRYVKEQ